MIEIYYGLIKIRIWDSDTPDWSYNADINETYVINEINFLFTRKKSIAIELFKPVGGHFLYGALSLQYIPDGKRPLEICISSMQDIQNIYAHSSSTLAQNLDVIYVGLEHEYAEGVRDGICTAQSLRKLGGGKLKTTGALCGEISSCIAIFRELGNFAIDTLTLPSIDNKIILELLQKKL